MTNKKLTANTRKGATFLLQSGLIAKGIVYTILGVLALMAAFEVGGQSSKDADRTGVFNLLNRSIAGNLLLPLLATGLVCYSMWRFVVVYRSANRVNKDWRKSGRYLLSGIVYLFAAFSAFKIIFTNSGKSGDSQQKFASELLSKPFGQWLLGIAALVVAGIGVYQVYYGLSEKYKKHVNQMNQHSKASDLILSAGKSGYVARGIVWLIISYMMLQAAIAASSSKAGNTGKAFEILENSPMGSYLLGTLGIGLIAYGFFTFIRARYEKFS